MFYELQTRQGVLPRILSSVMHQPLPGGVEVLARERRGHMCGAGDRQHGVPQCQEVQVRKALTLLFLPPYPGGAPESMPMRRLWAWMRQRVPERSRHRPGVTGELNKVTPERLIPVTVACLKTMYQRQ